MRNPQSISSSEVLTFKIRRLLNAKILHRGSSIWLTQLLKTRLRFWSKDVLFWPENMFLLQRDSLLVLENSLEHVFMAMGQESHCHIGTMANFILFRFFFLD